MLETLKSTCTVVTFVCFSLSITGFIWLESVERERTADDVPHPLQSTSAIRPALAVVAAEDQAIAVISLVTQFVFYLAIGNTIAMIVTAVLSGVAQMLEGTLAGLGAAVRWLGEMLFPRLPDESAPETVSVSAEDTHHERT